MTARKLCGMIIGPPGSGKSTLSERIATMFKIAHISIGDILRQNVIEKTKLGLLVHDYLTEGNLVPDKIFHESIMNEIKKHNNLFMLDGYPRTINQAEDLAKHFMLDACIYLNIPFHIIIKRLSTRWTHIKSGRVYNIGFHDAKVRYRDDVTGEPLEQRDDDKPKAIIRRLKVYEDTTTPVIDYYRKKKILHEFSSKTSDDIWLQVKKMLETKLK